MQLEYKVGTKQILSTTVKSIKERGYEDGGGGEGEGEGRQWNSETKPSTFYFIFSKDPPFREPQKGSMQVQQFPSAAR